MSSTLPQTDEEALDTFVYAMERLVEWHSNRLDSRLSELEPDRAESGGRPLWMTEIVTPGVMPSDLEGAIPSDPLARCPLCGALTRVPTFCPSCTDFVPAGPITSHITDIQRQMVEPFVRELAEIGHHVGESANLFTLYEGGWMAVQCGCRRVFAFNMLSGETRGSLREWDCDRACRSVVAARCQAEQAWRRIQEQERTASTETG